MISGIDISAWDGDFDLAKAQEEGFEFVIVKAGGSDCGRYTDRNFTANYAKAKALGMPVGVYWYTDARTVDAAVADAEYLYEHCLKGRQFELPVYFDVEGNMLKLSRRLLTDICHAWCKRLEELGFFVGIYSGFYSFRDSMFDNELQRYAHWLAVWGTKHSYQGDCLGMWQYGGETNAIRSNKVAGQVCDQNYMLVDYPGIIKAAGKNGFEKPAAVAPAPETPKEEKATEETDVFYRLELGDFRDKAEAIDVAARLKEFGLGEPRVVAVEQTSNASKSGSGRSLGPEHGVDKLANKTLV